MPVQVTRDTQFRSDITMALAGGGLLTLGPSKGIQTLDASGNNVVSIPPTNTSITLGRIEIPGQANNLPYTFAIGNSDHLPWASPTKTDYTGGVLLTSYGNNLHCTGGIVGSVIYMGFSTGIGGWRLFPNSLNLLVQQNVAGVWTTKLTI